MKTMTSINNTRHCMQLIELPLFCINFYWLGDGNTATAKMHNLATVTQCKIHLSAP